MKIRFVQKRYMDRAPVQVAKNTADNKASETVASESNIKENKKKDKKNRKMNTNEQFEKAEAIMDMMAPEVKVVKQDRGLIERTESSKIILTEDNRQVLND